MYHLFIYFIIYFFNLILEESLYIHTIRKIIIRLKYFININNINLYL